MAKPLLAKKRAGKAKGCEHESNEGQGGDARGESAVSILAEGGSTFAVGLQHWGAFVGERQGLIVLGKRQIAYSLRRWLCGRDLLHTGLKVVFNFGWCSLQTHGLSDFRLNGPNTLTGGK